METGLAIVSTINAVTFFQPGMSADVLDKLEIEVRDQASKLDISTDAGRKAIASLAHKVAKSKTGLDAAGKDLVAGEKARLKLIDTERGKVWDRLEALQEEVRRPLTEWEEADKIRCAKLEADVMTMASYGSIPYGSTTADIESLISKVDALKLTNMMEFTSRAELAEAQTRKALGSALAEAKQRDADKAENERLRKEAAEREQKERDERIAKEAREKAQREAEAERLRVEQDKFEAEARAKQAEAARVESERLAEERRVAAEARAKQEAEDAAKRHAEALAQAEDRRKLEAKIAEEVAENRRLAAVEAERERVAAEARKVAAETEAREKDKKHKASINNAAVVALGGLPGISTQLARDIVTAIAKGEIPNVKISY